MHLINMHQAKTHLSRLVRQACDGQEVIVGRAGEPLVRLVAFKAGAPKRKSGLLKGKIRIADDFEETPTDMINVFYGRDDAAAA
jgi:prevent-host-death family protein